MTKVYFVHDGMKFENISTELREIALTYHIVYIVTNRVNKRIMHEANTAISFQNDDIYETTKTQHSTMGLDMSKIFNHMFKLYKDDRFIFCWYVDVMNKLSKYGDLEQLNYVAMYNFLFNKQIKRKQL